LISMKWRGIRRHVLKYASLKVMHNIYINNKELKKCPISGNVTQNVYLRPKRRHIWLRTATMQRFSSCSSCKRVSWYMLNLAAPVFCCRCYYWTADQKTINSELSVSMNLLNPIHSGKDLRHHVFMWWRMNNFMLNKLFYATYTKTFKVIAK
jgi:hypothetical protein